MILFRAGYFSDNSFTKQLFCWRIENIPMYIPEPALLKKMHAGVQMKLFWLMTGRWHAPVMSEHVVFRASVVSRDVSVHHGRVEPASTAAVLVVCQKRPEYWVLWGPTRSRLIVSVSADAFFFFFFFFFGGVVKNGVHFWRNLVFLLHAFLCHFVF